MPQPFISESEEKQELQVSLYIAASLDGFIARSEGSIDWLENLAGSDDDYGYGEFMETVKVSVMGRRTYEQVRTFPEWPYEGRRTVVMSSGDPLNDARVETSAETPAALVARLRAEYPGDGGRLWLVGGGALASAFLAAHLVDEMVLTIVPVLLGDGIRLFQGGFPETLYRHQETRTFITGFVQLTYLKQIG
jgi:dihydrofolate reductase